MGQAYLDDTIDDVDRGEEIDRRVSQVEINILPAGDRHTPPTGISNPGSAPLPHHTIPHLNKSTELRTHIGREAAPFEKGR